jgi:hypothetical protein
MPSNEIVDDKLNKIERKYEQLCDDHRSTDPLVLRIAFYGAAIQIAMENPVDDEYAQNAIVAYLDRVQKVSIDQLATRLKDKFDY